MTSAVRTYPDGREVCENSAAGKREYDRRKVQMWDRQEERCAICLRTIPSNLAFFDHALGRGHGSGHRDDRILVDGKWQNAALCWDCNSEKQSRRYHWVDGHYIPVIK